MTTKLIIPKIDELIIFEAIQQEVIFTYKDKKIYWLVFKPYELNELISDKDVILIPRFYQYIKPRKITKETFNIIFA